MIGEYNVNYLFLEYPKCSTCKNTKEWLEDKGISFEDRDIVINNPTLVGFKESEWKKL